MTTEWKTIDSAPMDWTDVLLHDPELSSDTRKVCEGYYDREEGRWTSAMFGHIAPTHWAPLPEPPHAQL